MTISKELLDELLIGVEKPEDFFGDKGLMKGDRQVAGHCRQRYVFV